MPFVCRFPGQSSNFLLQKRPQLALCFILPHHALSVICECPCTTPYALSGCVHASCRMPYLCVSMYHVVCLICVCPCTMSYALSVCVHASCLICVCPCIMSYALSVYVHASRRMPYLCVSMHHAVRLICVCPCIMPYALSVCIHVRCRMPYLCVSGQYHRKMNMCATILVSVCSTRGTQPVRSTSKMQTLKS